MADLSAPSTSGTAKTDKGEGSGSGICQTSCLENVDVVEEPPLSPFTADGQFLTSDQSASGEYGFLALLYADSESYDDDGPAKKKRVHRPVHQEDGSVTWSDDYTTFTGTLEEFCEESGPKIEAASPSNLFTQIWDRPVIEQIVKETNNYAWQKIAQASETGISPQSKMNDWVETSVEEIYRLLALLTFMDLSLVTVFKEYWYTGVFSMPGLRRIMSEDRFMLLMRFLHFTDNNTLLTQGYDRKIGKIKPIVDYLNTKFKAAYTPCRELSINEAMLLWKGPSKLQLIRTKSARIGVRSFELCEAASGYVLRTHLYSGKCTTTPEPSLGFKSAYAQMAVKLMDGYLGKGFTIFLDEHYNSVSLTKYLKARGTDVVGGLNIRRTGAPTDIKSINIESMSRGSVIGRHCGDVSVVAWKNCGLVVTLSTYHNDEVIPDGRLGQPITKPVVVNDYNLFKGKVYVTEDDFSKNKAEREQKLKWYQKVFRRLLRTSIQNAYFIYCSTIGQNKKLSHYEFSNKLIEELLEEVGLDNINDPTTRLDEAQPHFPEEISKENTCKEKEYCLRCLAKKKRTTAKVVCIHCYAFLCEGQCWEDYHTLQYL